LRVLFDTNVNIAALINEGFCTRLLHYTAKHHPLISSIGLIKEFEEKLAENFIIPKLILQLQGIRFCP